MSTEHCVPLESVKDLIAVGQPLPFHVMDEFGRKLLAVGQVVTSATQMEMLIFRGAWAHQVEVDDYRHRLATEPAKALLPTRIVSLFDLWEDKLWELDAVLRKVLAGRPSAEDINGLALSLAKLIGRDPDVALFMVVRQNEPRFALYALSHALHTATLAMMLARQMAWSVADTAQLLCAALTMNVSTLELQARMAVQQDPPTTKQLDQIRAHPQASADFLHAAGVVSEPWLTAVLQHHERPDGSGYPLGGTDLSELAHALRVTDVLAAKISPRAFRPAMSVQQAAKQLFQDEQGGPMASALIKAMGLYPPGDLVQLKSGEVAVVIRRGHTATTPQVATLSNAAGKPVVESHVRDTADPAYTIAGPLADRQPFPRVLPERVYGYIKA